MAEYTEKQINEMNLEDYFSNVLKGSLYKIEDEPTLKTFLSNERNATKMIKNYEELFDDTSKDMSFHIGEEEAQVYRDNNYREIFDYIVGVAMSQRKFSERLSIISRIDFDNLSTDYQDNKFMADNVVKNTVINSLNNDNELLDQYKKDGCLSYPMLILVCNIPNNTLFADVGVIESIMKIDTMEEIRKEKLLLKDSLKSSCIEISNQEEQPQARPTRTMKIL